MKDRREVPEVGRFVVLGAVAVYGFLCARDPGAFGFLDGVNLLIHEAGHVIFTPFGEFAHFLGGTLLQILIPLAFTIQFSRTGQRFASMIALFWVAQSLFNVSVYVRDARAQALPLLGGEFAIHDWAYMLGRLGMLPHDQMLGGVIHLVGVLLLIYAVVQGFFYAREPAPARAHSPAPLLRI